MLDGIKSLIAWEKDRIVASRRGFEGWKVIVSGVKSTDKGKLILYHFSINSNPDHDESETRGSFEYVLHGKDHVR